MTMFAIYYHEEDMCGNYDNTLMGYCEFDTPAEAEKCFPTRTSMIVIRAIFPALPNEVKERIKHRLPPYWSEEEKDSIFQPIQG